MMRTLLKSGVMFVLFATAGLACQSPQSASEPAAAQAKADEIADLSTVGSVDLSSPALQCGASPIELHCASADGMLVMDTQINRDANADGFDGLTTRHECTENQLIVNGKDLGAQALVGSFFLSSEDGFTIIDHAKNDAKVALKTYWKIDLSDANAKVTGLAQVRLQISNTQASAVLITTEGKFSEIPVSCE